MIFFDLKNHFFALIYSIMSPIWLLLPFIILSLGCSCENRLAGDGNEDFTQDGVEEEEALDLVESGEMEECSYDVIDPGPLNAEAFNIENAVCREDGWCWHWPYPIGAVLNDITADNDGTIYAVGNYGTILRWPMEGRPSLLGRGEAGDSMLWTIWIADDGTLWLGGARHEYETPVIFKYRDGALERESFEVVDPAGQHYGYIHRIRGEGEQLWAVGSKGAFSRSPEMKDCLALSLVDNSWQELTPPCDSTLLHDIAFSPSGEVWIADPGGSLHVYNPSSESWRKVVPEPPHPWARLWWINGALYLFAIDGTFARMDGDENYVPIGSVPQSYQPRYDGSIRLLFPLYIPVYAGDDGTFTTVVNRYAAGISIYEVSGAGVSELFSSDAVSSLVTTIEKQSDFMLGFGSAGYTFSFDGAMLDEIYRVPQWYHHGISFWEQGEDIVAVTTNGYLLRFTGAQWEPVSRVPGLSEESHGGYPLWADEGCVFTANREGVFRYMNSKWESIPFSKIEHAEYVDSICGFSCEDVYWVTNKGRLLQLTECGLEEIPPPDDPNIIFTNLWCRPPDNLYVSGRGLYLWDGEVWTILLPPQRKPDGSWIVHRFVWGHEDDDTLYLDHRRPETSEDLGYVTKVFVDGAWQEWSCVEGDCKDCMVQGIRGFDSDTIWGFTNFSWKSLRPGDGDWENAPVLFGQPGGYGYEAWVTRNGKVFILGSGSDTSYFSVRGMSVLTTEETP